MQELFGVRALYTHVQMFFSYLYKIVTTYLISQI